MQSASVEDSLAATKKANTTMASQCHRIKRSVRRIGLIHVRAPKG